MLAASLNPPIQYSIVWLLLGLATLLLIGLWYAVIFWLTRKKPIKTISDLPYLNAPVELAALKAKYLALIEECYQGYRQGKTDMRGLHRGLSMAVRYFVYEVNHFPAPRLTLSDLMRTPYVQLTRLIGQYYPDEFAAIRQSNAEASTQAAKELVQQWV